MVRRTPKRNVVSSSLAGGAKFNRYKPFSMVYSGLLLQFHIFCCFARLFYAAAAAYSANFFRTVFAVLLIKSEEVANPTFPSYFPDGTTDNSAVSILISSGHFCSCSSSPSRSREELADRSGSFTFSGFRGFPAVAPNVGRDWRRRRRHSRTSAR